MGVDCLQNPSTQYFDCDCNVTDVIRNFFNISAYACHSSFFQGDAALPNSAGLAVVLGLGGGFAVLCLLITIADYKYVLLVYVIALQFCIHFFSSSHRAHSTHCHCMHATCS